MATNPVRWTRDYLAARDLDSEVAGGLVVERLDVDHLSATPIALERLEAPLPPRVRLVAVASLVVFGVLCGAGALFVVGGGVAVVVMPILMGREGVGTAMITLFTVCVTFVISGILLLAARSAARVIRRERRGVRTLYLFAITGLIVAILAFAITQWLSAAFFGMDDSTGATSNWSMVLRLAEPLAMFVFAWVALVMRQYDRKLPSSN